MAAADPSGPPGADAPEPRKPPSASLELVARARAGDRPAREELCARYYPRVFRVVRARMGRALRALEAPEDLVQETFLAALGALERFEAREVASLFDWFARLTEHQIHDAVKHHGAQKRARAAERPLEGHEPAARDTPPLERLSRAEEARILDECIAELPHDEREALVLRDHADASWTLIAGALGRPSEGAARELYRRAQVRLMELFRRRAGPA